MSSCLDHLTFNNAAVKSECDFCQRLKGTGNYSYGEGGGREKLMDTSQGLTLLGRDGNSDVSPFNGVFGLRVWLRQDHKDGFKGP